MTPFVNQGKLEHRRINAMKWENVLVQQSFPNGCHPPNDPLCLQEDMRRVDTKSLEGHWRVVPISSPDISGFARRNGNFSMRFEPSKRAGGMGELQYPAGDIP